MSTDKYTLEGKTPVPCDDLIKWGKWFETAERHVAKEIIGSVSISTVFLGLNHRFGAGAPLLFETMIFGGAHDGYQERCSTWEEAEEEHKIAVNIVRLDQ